MNKIVQTKENIFDALKKNADKIGQFGVKRIGIFGSFARGNVSEESDVDVFVEFYPDKKTFRNFMALAFFLEDLFGRRVELITPESLSPHIKPFILEEVEYVEAVPLVS